MGGPEELKSLTTRLAEGLDEIEERKRELMALADEIQRDIKDDAVPGDLIMAKLEEMGALTAAYHRRVDALVLLGDAATKAARELRDGGRPPVP